MLNLLLSFYFSYMQIMLVSLWILKEKWKVLSCNTVFYRIKPKYCLYWWGKCILLNAKYQTRWHVGANDPLYLISWYTHGIFWSYVAWLKWERKLLFSPYVDKVHDSWFLHIWTFSIVVVAVLVSYNHQSREQWTSEPRTGSRVYQTARSLWLIIFSPLWIIATCFYVMSNLENFFQYFFIELRIYFDINGSILCLLMQ